MPVFKLSLLIGAGLFCFSIILCCNPDNSADAEQSSSLTGNLPLDLLNKEIRKNPGDASLYFDRANFYLGIEDYQAAIGDMERAVAIDTANVDYYHFLADLYLDNYQSQQALTTMELTNVLFPDRIPSLLKLSEFQLILKQHDKAFSTVGKVIQLQPRNPEAYYMLGMIYQDQGNSLRAIQSFQTVTELKSDHIDAWISLGQLYSNEKNKLAIQCFDNAIGLDSTKIDAWHGKAFYLQESGMEQEALGIYRKIHKIDLQYPDAYLNAGILLLEMDSVEKAREEFHMMSKVDPANALAYFYLGVIAEQSGEYTKALHQFKQAYTLSPDFQRAKDAVLRLQQAGQGEM